MKKNFPKVIFFYSAIYDRLLTEYEGKCYEEKQKEEIEKFIRKFEKEWRKIEEPLFKFLLTVISPKNIKKEIICYVVKNLKWTGFSHPLTIKMSTIWETKSTLLHEIIHILFLRSNKRKIILQKLRKRFPFESHRTLEHIYVILLHYLVLKKLFKKKTIKNLLAKYQRFKETGKVWKTVLENEKELKRLLLL